MEPKYYYNGSFCPEAYDPPISEDFDPDDYGQDETQIEYPIDNAPEEELPF